jgi:DNA invertase Pin-like site-specific DNA recombinase
MRGDERTVTQTTAKQSGSDVQSLGRLRVVLYAHVNGRNPEGLRSLAIQLETLQRHARRERWTIVGEFADAEAGGPADRPGLSRALIDAADGQYDVLLVYALDRIARSVRDAAYVFDELDRAGILVQSVTDVIDVTTLGQQGRSLICSAIAAGTKTPIPAPGENHES